MTPSMPDTSEFISGCLKLQITLIYQWVIGIFGSIEPSTLGALLSATCVSFGGIDMRAGDTKKPRQSRAGLYAGSSHNNRPRSAFSISRDGVCRYWLYGL